MGIRKTVNKITAPKMAGVLHRERLFRSLDQGISRPAVWVSGPGGAGKTTLVADYLETSACPVVWYQVDGSDSDCASFFYFLSQAARRAAPGRRRPLPRFGPEHLLDLHTFSRRYFEAFFASMSGNSVIVFDNCQDAGSPQFHEIIWQCVEAVPSGSSVIMISRENPPSSFARLTANGRLARLDWEDLRFTENETFSFIRARHAKDLPEEEAKLLHARSEGWIAGLVLLLEHVRRNGTKPAFSAELAPNELFHYFAAEVFERQTPELQNLLLCTAIPPYVTVPLATSLTGNRQARRILAELTANNFFITRQHSQEVYQYHQLFRDFLLSKTLQVWEDDELSRIVLHAASLLEDAGDAAEAVKLYIKACDWSAAEKLIREHADGLLFQGRGETVREWLEALPTNLRTHDADLLMIHGICMKQLDLPSSLELFRRSFLLHRQNNDRAGMFLAWSHAADVTIHVGEFRTMIEWLNLLEELLKEKQSFPSKKVEGRVVMSTFNAMSYIVPDHPDIALWQERAYALVLHDSSLDIDRRMACAAYLGTYYNWKGDVARATAIYDFLQAHTGDNGLSDLVFLVVSDVQVIHLILNSRFEEAAYLVKGALEHAAQCGVTVWTAQLLGHGIWTALCAGDSGAADNLLGQLAAHVVETRRFDQATYHFAQGWRAMTEGRHAQALHHIGINTENIAGIGFLAAEGVSYSCMAELMGEIGLHDEARQTLSKGYAIAARLGSKLIEYFCLLVDAQLCINSGDEERGAELFGKAFRLGRLHGYRNKLLWRPEVMADLCARALERGIETEYALELIEKRGLRHFTPSEIIEEWPWHVKVRTLGRFALSVGGKEVSFSGKVPRKPMELLKALIAVGGAEMREGQLADLLWQEVDGDIARNSFKVTLHRLRELLGGDKALQFQEGRLVMDWRHVWTDVRAFESLLAMAQIKAEAGEEAGAASLVGKALSLYHGHFLAGEDKPWAERLRGKLAGKFTLHAVAVGRLNHDKGNFQRAIDLFERGLNVDPHNEQLYRRLMQSFHAAGLKSQAVAAYHRCCKVLAEDLGVLPSADTKSLFQQIQS